MNENTQWNARIFTDKALKKEVQKEIKMLTLVLLGNNKLKINYRKEGFDNQPYYKYRPVTMYYEGRFRDYAVYGNTRIDVYLEVLKLLANDSSVYFPIFAPRTDDEWVERT